MVGKLWARCSEVKRSSERTGARRSSRRQWRFDAGKKNASSTKTHRLNREVDALKATTAELWASWRRQGCSGEGDGGRNALGGKQRALRSASTGSDEARHGVGEANRRANSRVAMSWQRRSDLRGRRRRTDSTWRTWPDGGRPLGLTKTTIRPAIRAWRRNLTTFFLLNR